MRDATSTTEAGPTKLIRRDELLGLLDATREPRGAHAHVIRRGPQVRPLGREPSALRGLVWVVLAAALVRWLVLWLW